jgi:peptide-methionine (S)-S-oxide reductase
MPTANNHLETATLAGGCFWCTEAIFKRLKGVKSVEPGYSGGLRENPTYKDVCSGKTGHAEAIQIEFDPKEIYFEKLLEVFFALHNPTTLNRQGVDFGTQYRSSIFYHSDDQKRTAEKVKLQLDRSGQYKNKIVTEIVPYAKFYKAENYHQNYYDSNPKNLYCKFVIDPKIKKLIKNFKTDLIVEAKR